MKTCVPGGIPFTISAGTDGATVGRFVAGNGAGVAAAVLSVAFGAAVTGFELVFTFAFGFDGVSVEGSGRAVDEDSVAPD